MPTITGVKVVAPSVVDMEIDGVAYRAFRASMPTDWPSWFEHVTGLEDAPTPTITANNKAVWNQYAQANGWPLV